MKTPKHFKRTELFLATCLITGSFAPVAMAQAPAPTAEVSEILITGSRRSGMAVSDSPAPVQLISSEMLKESGSPDLMNAIATQVPSYNARQTGTDMASQTLTASMRALSANHALVLVNGKRRHITSNVGASSGNAAADLSFIPSSAIERLEVLTDGAAAIYGSDAIAGVVNIILKDDYEGGTVNTNISEYTDGGGYTTNIQADAGFGSDTAFLNLSVETEERDTVSRSITYGPALCVANPTECLNRLNNGTPSGYTVSSAYRTYIERDSKMATAPGFPTLNNQGDPPDVARAAVFFNAGYEFSEDMNFYSFGSMGRKEASSLQTYRRPSQDGGVDVNKDGDRNDLTPAGVREFLVNKYEFGFTPKLASDEKDFSLTAGINGTTNDWMWDVSSTYGDNEIEMTNTNSMNFSLWNLTGQSPDRFYLGAFEGSQWTTSLDVSKEFEVGMAAPMTFATGLEYRKDTYGISAGEPASYFGSGAAAFPGYNAAVNTGDYDRNSYATFLNFVFVPTNDLLVDLAVRYEDYSDFGNKTVGKITARYDFADGFAVRATASTGFRAPTLGEGFYSAVNVAPTSATPQLQPNSPGAAALGFGAGLQPETSENFSIGLVLEPIDGLTTTIDAYEITISDRIQRGSFNFSQAQSNNTITGRTTGKFNNILPDPADTNGDGRPDDTYNEALGRALVDFGYIGVWNDPVAPGGSLDPTARAAVSVAIFNNSLETKTTGVDWVNTYNSRFGWGSINWTMAANYNKTEVSERQGSPCEPGWSRDVQPGDSGQPGN
jgi:iron complex outermembrane receptor protein